MVGVSRFHTVIRGTKLLPFHGYTLPQGLRILLWSSIQLVDMGRVWRIRKRLLVSSHGNYMYHFCPIFVGPNGFICPHLSAKDPGKCSLWASRKRKWILLKTPAQAAFLTTKYIFHYFFLTQKTSFLQAKSHLIIHPAQSAESLRWFTVRDVTPHSLVTYGLKWHIFNPPPSHTLV